MALHIAGRIAPLTAEEKGLYAPFVEALLKKAIGSQDFFVQEETPHDYKRPPSDDCARSYIRDCISASMEPLIPLILGRLLSGTKVNRALRLSLVQLPLINRMGVGLLKPAFPELASSWKQFCYTSVKEFFEEAQMTDDRYFIQQNMTSALNVVKSSGEPDMFASTSDIFTFVPLYHKANSSPGYCRISSNCHGTKRLGPVPSPRFLAFAMRKV
jgi:hypothetical protein